MWRLWPDPAGPVDDDSLIPLYAPEPAHPTLRVNFVSSLDGAVTVDGRSAGLSSPADKKVFGILRMVCDVLLVGAGTVRAEGYGPVRLSPDRRGWRERNGLSSYPVLAVVSASLDLDPAASCFAEAPVRPVVLTHAGAPADRRAALELVADVLDCGSTAVDLAAGLAQLRDRGLAQVLCEGGPHLFGSLQAAGLVDEVCLTYAPLLAGPGAGRIIAGPPTPVSGMRLAHLLLADDMLLSRYVRR